MRLLAAPCHPRAPAAGGCAAQRRPQPAGLLAAFRREHREVEIRPRFASGGSPSTRSMCGRAGSTSPSPARPEGAARRTDSGPAGTAPIEPAYAAGQPRPTRRRSNIGTRPLRSRSPTSQRYGTHGRGPASGAADVTRSAVYEINDLASVLNFVRHRLALALTRTPSTGARAASLRPCPPPPARRRGTTPARGRRLPDGPPKSFRAPAPRRRPRRRTPT
jgi:hypothetical protein